MRGVGGHSGGFPDGDRNQHGDAGFCTFVCSARPLSLRNGFFCSLLCFAAGIALITFGIVTYIYLSQTNPGLAWQRLIYIGIGAMTILSGAVALGRVCCMYRSYRRHREQTAQNVAFHENVGTQQPWMTGGQTTPYQPYGPAGQQQPQPGYPSTVGLQYHAGAYPHQQTYPQAGGAVPLHQRTSHVPAHLSDGTSRTGYPPTAHAQESGPSAPPPYDDVVIEQNKI